MKRFLLVNLACCLGALTFAQVQIDNSDMEAWESVPNGGEEPVNWNSFMTASGGLTGQADVQVEQSTDVRPGTSGSTSAHIWSRNAGFNIVANGNLTLGQVNMGSIIANDIANHNSTIVANGDFNQPITSVPDSIVFWAKFILGGGTPGLARMKATVHDDWDYQDPEDTDDGAHVVGRAELDYPPTSGWERFAIAFDSVGPATVASYILVTFATNNVPSGGNIGDEVWIDDVELIYNPLGIDDEKADEFVVAMNNSTNTLQIQSENQLTGAYSIFNAMGQQVQTGEIANEIAFDKQPGVYFVHLLSNDQTFKFEILKN